MARTTLISPPPPPPRARARAVAMKDVISCSVKVSVQGSYISSRRGICPALEALGQTPEAPLMRLESLHPKVKKSTALGLTTTSLVCCRCCCHRTPAATKTTALAYDARRALHSQNSASFKLEGFQLCMSMLAAYRSKHRSFGFSLLPPKAPEEKP